MIETIKKGDLVHIPQGVLLWEQLGPGAQMMVRTTRPRAAVYLGIGVAKCEAESYAMNSNHRSLIFLDGKKFGVRCDQIYLLNEKTQEKIKSVG